MNVFKCIFVFLVALATLAEAKLTPTELNRFQREFVAEIYKRYADSVVYVTGEFADPRKEELKEFFNIPGQKTSDSIGTGFFIADNGYVITNAHGVYKSVSAVVELRDGARYNAQIVGFILEEDLALLKIDPKEPIKAIEFREDSEIEVGEPVASISHPHGLKYTCAQGIVSAIGRRSLLSDINVTVSDLVQTDMSINPGSSGGPWFDVNGRVVALTTSRRNGSDNIAFGVSAQKILNALPELFDFPHRNGFVRGFSVTLKNGAVTVGSVEKSSPAAKAGLKEGDEIIAVNGKNVSGMMEYLSHEEKFAPGQNVVLTIGSKNGKQIRFALEKWNAPDVNDELWRRLGVKVRPIAKQEVDRCHLKSSCACVITEVDPKRYGSLKDKIYPGDVLGRIADVRPENLFELNRLLTRIKPGAKIKMVVLRAINADTKKPLTEPSETANTSEKTNPNAINVTKTRINISNFEAL